MNIGRFPWDKLFWGALSLLAVIYALLPVAWILSLSFKKPADLNDRRFFPDEVYWGNYRAVFSDTQFPEALWNSVGIALIATFLSVTLAMFAAYAIVRLEFPGKRAVLAAALAIAMFPPVAIIGPLFNLWRVLGFIRHLGRTYFAVYDFYLAVVDLDAGCIFSGNPLGSGQGRKN